MRLRNLIRFVFMIVNVTVLCSGATYKPSAIVPPKPSREFRGAWVATVSNIDWPSKRGLSTADQKAELIAILDKAAKLKLNAIIFQVRPACDAMYASQLEPWSEYLTGTMGKAPEPFYDPLAFAVKEAHKRGLELHAWFNPYRARLSADNSLAAPNHISKTRPHLVKQYGKLLWLDPGEKEVQDYSLRVVMDVVRRYNVDGVHFDDYFYPYKERDASGDELDFPDDASWRRFGAGKDLSRDDWRRENVNAFIRRVYQSIKLAKPWVKFGVSPFGIWRPGHPSQIQGYDPYVKLYADSRKWFQNGWVDYFSPQLYWSIDAKEQSYPVLLKWWAEHNTSKRHLWPGINTTKAGGDWLAKEIANQIRVTRAQSGATGHIHWNMKSLMRGRGGLTDLLEEELYSEPALIPASTWLGDSAPGRPELSVRRRKSFSPWQVTWQRSGTNRVALWVLQTRTGNVWTTEVLSGGTVSQVLPDVLPEVIALTAVDRCGDGSQPAVFERKAR